MKKIFLIVLVYQYVILAQSDYPQDYFRPPLDIPMILSGTFGELRPNHFHAGLDIKTQQREGLKVYAVAEGYVSRINVSSYGYGKVLYVTHPNGYTSVYAHLKSFSPKIEAYIKELQYKDETFEVEVYPKFNELKVNTSEIIAYSGNTGGSGGPHLHFEIRDNQERPINPMLFGLDIKDSINPAIYKLYAYSKSDESSVNGNNNKVELRLIPKANGDYEVENIEAFGTIGFGIVAYDKLDFAANNNGLNNIKTYLNGNKMLEVDFKRFSFTQGKQLNRYIDYEAYKYKGTFIQKLFVEPNNELEIFKFNDNNGLITIKDNTSYIYKIVICDFKNNEITVNIPIKGKFTDVKPLKNNSNTANNHLISESGTTVLESKYATVHFYPHTVYEDIYINYKSKLDTLYIHNDLIPLKNSFYINYDISKYQTKHQHQLYIAKLVGYKNSPRYLPTTQKGNILSASSKTFGKFALAIDSLPPKITPLNFKDQKWISNYRYLTVKISDYGSGISKYYATVNGKWILMEYDHKTNTLTHDFNDNIIKDEKNNFKLIVTDNVGNSSTFEATFYRK